MTTLEQIYKQHHQQRKSYSIAGALITRKMWQAASSGSDERERTGKEDAGCKK